MANLIENMETCKREVEKTAKLSLKGYYEALPRPVPPKTEFIRRVAERCGVDMVSVRNWCLYGVKPSKQEHIDILVEMTGIKEEDLW